MVYSNQEAHDMLQIFFESGSIAKTAERLWRERYPERFPHSRKVFTRLSQRIRTEGIVQPHHNKGKIIRRRVRDERSADIIASTMLTPQDSLRRRERDSGVGASTIRRILEDTKFHPYRMQLHQHLAGDDFQQRLNFCDWYLGQPDNFHREIFRSDECTLKTSAH